MVCNWTTIEDQIAKFSELEQVAIDAELKLVEYVDLGIIEKGSEDYKILNDKIKVEDSGLLEDVKSKMFYETFIGLGHKIRVLRQIARQMRSCSSAQSRRKDS